MERSFDDVYALYGGEVHGYLARLLGDAWAADEVCQETFVRYLARERELIALNGSLRPWLYRVATNLGIDRLRRRKLRKRPPPHDRRPADQVTGDARSTDDADMGDRIRTEVDALPPPLRATFLLRAHHGLTYADVARALGISERAAKDRFKRTRELLAHRLRHLLEERPS